MYKQVNRFTILGWVGRSLTNKLMNIQLYIVRYMRKRIYI